jgi:hypothetical protein
MPRKTRSNQAPAQTQVASALRAIADALTIPNQPVDVVLPPAEDLELLAVRHLNAGHLGRWVDFPGRPITAAESAIGTPAGRLVGIRITEGQRLERNPSRVLLIQSGTRTDPFTYPLDQPVHVAPRSWS